MMSASILRLLQRVTRPVVQNPRKQRTHQARLRLESLEDRLALSWGGVPPSAITPPSNAVAVTLDAQASAQGSAAITANEADFYTFTATRSGTYRVNASTPNSSLDTVLGVYSASGGRLAYNDDISSTNRDSQLTVNLTAGVRYYFGISNYVGTAGGAYSWLVTGPAAALPDDAYEDNDSFAQASNLGTLTAPTTVSGLALADSADWFRFTTTAAGTSASSVAIAFQQTQGNLALQLYNSNGQLVSSANGTGNSETISLNTLAAGTWYVRVTGTSGATNPNYSLTVTPPVATTPPPSTGGFDIVVRVNGLSSSQQQIFERAAARWEQIITGDLPNATYQGVAVDDMLIDAQGSAIDGAGGILGQAGPDALRSGSRLPYHGTMQFDSADLASMEANGTLYEVILHEMGHVLGIGTIWQTLGLLSGAGTTDPHFLGSRAATEYNAIFGTSISYVPVEGLPSGPGSRDGHWRESVFGNEIMTPYISGAGNPISRVTVASLADIGYTVNMAAADFYARPGSITSGGGGSGGSTSIVQGTSSVPVSTADSRVALGLALTLPEHVSRLASGNGEQGSFSTADEATSTPSTPACTEHQSTSDEGAEVTTADSSLARLLARNLNRISGAAEALLWHGFEIEAPFSA